jgi:hypothetical protein
MTEKTVNAIHVDVPREELLKTLADGNERAVAILEELITTAGDFVGPLFIDLASMNIRGTLLVAAYTYCQENAAELLERLRQRDPVLVDAINTMVSEGSRAHATQPTRTPIIDAAIHAALQEAGQDSINQVLSSMGEEGSAYVHEFFVALIVQMQRLGRFQVNFHVNLPTEGAERAVFAIALAELLTKDGKPFGIIGIQTQTEEAQA